jgi:ABC-type multidrug transport system fused ATPase/permease subunit
VSQDTTLFNRSVIENIRYSKPDATMDEIIEASKKANAHDFITELENGYYTKVGERGGLLSGGQRQRILIARAILKNSPILILDEATSALDAENEKIINDSLENLMEGKTVIAIAHKLNTLRQMDRIIVLKNGKIVESGKHDELLEKGGVYKTLWQIQTEGMIVE